MNRRRASAAAILAIIFFVPSIVLAQSKKEFIAKYREAERLVAATRPGQHNDKVVKKLEQCIEIAEQIDCPECRRDAYFALGQVLRSKQKERAIELLQKAVKIDSDLKNTKNEAESLRHLGVVYIFNRQAKKAAECYEKALEINRQRKDKASIAQNLVNLGMAYQFLNKYQESLECLEESLALARYGNRHQKDLARKWLAMAYVKLGPNLAREGKHDQFLEMGQKLLKLGKQRGNKGDQALAFSWMAIAYKGQKQYAEAEKCLRKAIRINKQMRNTKGAAANLVSLGRVYQAWGKGKKAEECLEKARALK
jgi:tetratricopeptide (TPR) repeat protein